MLSFYIINEINDNIEVALTIASAKAVGTILGLVFDSLLHKCDYKSRRQNETRSDYF